MTIPTGDSQLMTMILQLVLALVSMAIAYLTREAKRFLNTHTKGKVAEIGNIALDSLNKVASAYVHDVGSRLLSDVQQKGQLTPTLLAQIRSDVIQSIKDQHGLLIQQAQQAVGSMDKLLPAIAQQALNTAGYIAQPQQATTPASPPAQA